MEALTDRSRRPVRYANQLPGPVERLIVETKRDKPHWGVRKFADGMRIPARSRVHAVLKRLKTYLARSGLGFGELQKRPA